MSDEQVRAEGDNPNNLIIIGAVGVVVVVFLAIVIGVGQWFGFAAREAIDQKQLAPESSQLRALRADEQAKLNRYQWVDKSAGVVRIPLDEAAKLTLRDWPARQDGTVAPPAPAAPTAPAAPAPAIPEKK